jgi:hypothetical protein
MLSKNSEMEDVIPTEFYLSQNYPNPFKEKTIIKYCVGYKARVVLSVYNSEGEEIEKLIDEEKKPGTYEIEFHFVETWHPDKSGQVIPFLRYRLEAGDFRSEKIMILEK